MSFWIWVGVAIVVVLVVAFARDRRRAASRRGDKGADAERRLEGRDVKRDPHEGESWEAAAVAGDPSSGPGTTTPSASRDWVVNLSLNLRWRWEYPSVGERFGWCRRFGKFNDNWVGTNWKESYEISQGWCVQFLY